MLPLSMNRDQVEHSPCPRRFHTDRYPGSKCPSVRERRPLPVAVWRHRALFPPDALHRQAFSRSSDDGFFALGVSTACQALQSLCISCQFSLHVLCPCPVPPRLSRTLVRRWRVFVLKYHPLTHSSPTSFMRGWVRHNPEGLHKETCREGALVICSLNEPTCAISPSLRR